MITVYCKQLRKTAHLPKQMTESSSGADLFADLSESVIIAPRDIVLIPTGIAVELPKGYEAQIRPRSGLAVKHGIGILNAPGTIDADYRGEIKIIAFNFSNIPFTVEQGMRIAQMVIAAVPQVCFEERKILSETARGQGGFGHTGMNP